MQTRVSRLALKGIVAAGICLLVGSCDKNPVILWSPEARSPDNGHVAIAHTDNYAGPGNNANVTEVDLGQVGGLKPIQILGFSENDPYGIRVDMKWRDKNHLDVGYKGAHLYFQAVKALGVEISTHYITD